MKLKSLIPSSSPFIVVNKRRSRTYLGRVSLILICSLVSIGTGELIPLASAQPWLLAQSTGTNYGLGLPKSASTGGGTRLVNRDSLEIDENASNRQPRRGVIPSIRSRDRSPALLMRQLQPQPLLTLITPEDGGRTANAQPTLYWYLYDQPKQMSSFTNDLEHHVNETDETTHTTESQDCFVGQLRVILTEEQKDTATIFQTKLTTMKSGLSSFKLPIAASLQPSKSYRWEITLPAQQNELEEDVIVSGWIVYSPPESSLQKSLMRALTTRDRAKIYAEAGYWFEAIDDYTRWLKLNPNDLKTRSARNEILKSGFATNKNLDIDAFIGLLNTDATKSSVK